MDVLSIPEVQCVAELAPDAPFSQLQAQAWCAAWVSARSAARQSSGAWTLSRRWAWFRGTLGPRWDRVEESFWDVRGGRDRYEIEFAFALGRLHADPAPDAESRDRFLRLYSWGALARSDRLVWDIHATLLHAIAGDSRSWGELDDAVSRYLSPRGRDFGSAEADLLVVTANALASLSDAPMCFVTTLANHLPPDQQLLMKELRGTALRGVLSELGASAVPPGALDAALSEFDSACVGRNAGGMQVYTAPTQLSSQLGKPLVRAQARDVLGLPAITMGAVVRLDDRFDFGYAPVWVRDYPYQLRWLWAACSDLDVVGSERNNERNLPGRSSDDPMLTAICDAMSTGSLWIQDVGLVDRSSPKARSPVEARATVLGYLIRVHDEVGGAAEPAEAPHANAILFVAGPPFGLRDGMFGGLTTPVLDNCVLRDLMTSSIPIELQAALTNRGVQPTVSMLTPIQPATAGYRSSYRLSRLHNVVMANNPDGTWAFGSYYEQVDFVVTVRASAAYSDPASSLGRWDPPQSASAGTSLEVDILVDEAHYVTALPPELLRAVPIFSLEDFSPVDAVPEEQAAAFAQRLTTVIGGAMRQGLEEAARSRGELAPRACGDGRSRRAP